MIIEEKRKNTKGLKRLRKNLKLIITFSATIIAILYSIIEIFSEKWSNDWEISDTEKSLIIIFIVIISYFIILTFKEGFLTDIFFKLAGKINKDKYYEGIWNIVIEYNSNDGRGTIIRTGSCIFEDSISGLRIDGMRLLNESGEVEVDDWNSTNVELIEYADHTKLIYTYFTYESGSLNQTKIGLAILTRSTTRLQFDGNFRDFDVQDGKQLKEGKVKIFR